MQLPPIPEHLYHPKKILYLEILPWQPLIHFSVSIDLPVLDISCKRNHTMCGLLCLLFFLFDYLNLLTFPLSEYVLFLFKKNFFFNNRNPLLPHFLPGGEDVLERPQAWSPQATIWAQGNLRDTPDSPHRDFRSPRYGPQKRVGNSRRAACPQDKQHVGVQGFPSASHAGSIGSKKPVMPHPSCCTVSHPKASEIPDTPPLIL